ncbi:hypothetical protein TNCV_1273891 [Trichonephila clavipes]|nr:hypothetical protein TNCV_1273891 [Trichonephila clavipes]
MMDTLRKEAPGLVAKPIFNSSLDLIVGKSSSLQSFLEWTAGVMWYSHGERSRLCKGIFKNFPLELPQQCSVRHSNMKTSFTIITRYSVPHHRFLIFFLSSCNGAQYVAALFGSIHDANDAF